MRTRSLRDPRQGGFTLVELLVVVLLLAIMFGLAAVPTSGDGNATLDLAEVQLRDAFQYAQTLSYSAGSPHGVVFDPLEQRYAVVAIDGSAVANPLTHAGYLVDFRQPGQLTGVHISFANFGSTGKAGIFDGQGVPVAGGVVTLAKGAVSRSFSLNSATGKLEAL